MSIKNRNILILYASQTGTAQYLAEQLHRKLIYYCPQLRLLSIDQYNWLKLPEEDIIYFIISTTGDGVPPTSMLKFWQFLLIKDLPKDSLSNITFSVFGLGDSKYEKFNYASRKLRMRLIQLGGKLEIPQSAFGDEQHPCGVETEFADWTEKCLQIHKGINKLKQQPFILDSGITSQLVENDILQVQISHLNNYDNLKDKFNSKTDQNLIELIESNQLTPLDHEKTTLNLKFRSNLKYQPGDILIVKPLNSENLVRKLSSIIGFQNPEQINIKLIWNTYHPKSKIRNELSLFELLSEELDISEAPTRYFIEMMLKYCENPLHMEKLREMCSNTPEGLEQYYKYVKREKRNPYEILNDFQPCPITIQALILSLNLMRPREYSISTYDINMIGITCALVNYRTNFNRQIEGVCSQYLKQIKIGENIQGVIQKGQLEFPSDPDVPVIMIGPGTGVAPFISYLKFKEQKIGQGQNFQSSVLFFGACYEEKEFYYKEYLEDLILKKQLVLYKAFSRDQKNKIYVQDRINENKEFIKKLIEENYQRIMIFVAGTSKKMPSQVESTIQNIIGSDLLNLLKKNKQYQLECW